MKVLFKRIPGGTGQSHTERAHAVAAYMSNRENNKCIHIQGFGFRGCESDDIESMWREMADVANRHDRRNRLYCLAHYALSLQMEAGDQKPSPETLVAAARHAITEMGATSGTPYIVAVHDDRNHPHAHILFSRVDRDKHKIIDDHHTLDGEFVGGWKNHAQYTAASVAQEFGWEVPQGSKFQPSGKTKKVKMEDPETGLLLEVERPVPARKKARRSDSEPPGAATLEEKRTGLLSAERRIQQKARTIDLSTIRSFRELHKRLAEQGIYMEKVKRGRGYGLIFTDGERKVKGSSISLGWSLPELQKAFGEFQPPSQAEIAKARQVKEPPRLTEASLKELKKAGITPAQVKEIAKLPPDLVKNLKVKRKQTTALGVLSWKFGAVAAVKALVKRFPEVLERIRKEERKRELMFKRSIERASKKFWKEVSHAGYKQYQPTTLPGASGELGHPDQDLPGFERPGV